MNTLNLIANSPVIFLILIGVLSACVGSFLNVVIYRFPIMLNNRWRQQAREYLALESEPTPRPMNLFAPRSHCPHCQHLIPFYFNIPLLSYVLLWGKCHFCKHPIAWRYPIVELLTIVLSVTVAWAFGFTLQTLFALILTWGLIVMAFIDLQYQLLPDEITLSLLWLGLLLSLLNIFIPTTTAVIGAASGYLSLWSVYWLYKLITGKEGLGYGDFKLFAVFGAWLGWQMLPFIIIISAVVGSLFGIFFITLKKLPRTTEIPFGPYLASAGWIALIWGQQINHSYLTFITG